MVQGVTILRVAALAVVIVVASWAVLIVLARRLPPGLLKDAAGFLPAYVTTVRRLRRDPRVPQWSVQLARSPGLRCPADDRPTLFAMRSSNSEMFRRASSRRCRARS